MSGRHHKTDFGDWSTIMSRYLTATPFLAAGFLLVATPSRARSQTVPAACRPLVDAELKAISTPHHMYETKSDGRSGQEPMGELITAGGVTYVKAGGKWIRSPISLQAQIDQVNRNIATTKVYTCQRVGSETVAGMPATVYTLHTENADTKADARAWIGTGNGLMLKLDESVDGTGTKSHYLIRYEYTNISAPAGVK
jgi:hypothetical protein